MAMEIINLTNFKIDKKSFSQVAKIVLKSENRKKGNLSVVLVNPNEIKKLNKKYRKKNKITDVLAFGEFPNSQFPISNSLLGEIVICPEMVKKNAKKFNSDFKKELILVLIHGILHLLGYDHEGSRKKAEKMREKEEYYLSQI